MGREIRRVPPNWAHPTDERGKYMPLVDQSYVEARAVWLAGLAAHRPEEHDGMDWWEWEQDPPKRADYRPYSDSEATWFQVYETVSEGTPLTPPFPTLEQLKEHLIRIGSDYDGRWSREAAEAFCRPGAGWVPSMVVQNGCVYEAKDAAVLLKGDSDALDSH